MGNKIDRTGQRFGMLLVISETKKRDSTGSVIWECRCDCGKTTYVPARSLTPKTKSCGCLNRIDLTGRRSGMLVAIRPTEKRTKTNGVYWECKCDCGVTKLVAASEISKQGTKSCGCQIKALLYKRALQLEGQRFGHLVALERSEERASNGKILWKCQCDCGNITYVNASSLTAGITKSCGCLVQSLLKTAPAIVNGTSPYKFIDPKPTVKSQTGVLGVYYNQGKYIAGMRFQGRQVLLKSFDNIEDAIAARKAAEEKYHQPLLKELGFID